ncbi:MAG: hypothetical protein AAF267_02100 [Deinococcota bacterium]
MLPMVMLPQAAHAQRSIPLSAEPAQPYIGDVITLSFKLEHSYRTRVVMPDLAETWGDFEVVSGPHLRSEAAGVNQQRSHGSWTVQYFGLAPVQTPDLTLNLADPAGNLIPLTISPISLETVSLIDELAEDEPRLRDIKPPLTLTAPVPVWQGLWQRLVITSLALLALVMGALLYWRQLARWLNLPGRLTAQERLRQELLELAEVRTYTRPQLDAISQQIRTHLQLRYGVLAQGATSDELRDHLRRSTVPYDLGQAIVGVLLRCDATRFAARQLLHDDHIHIQQTLRALASSPKLDDVREAQTTQLVEQPS